MVAIIIIFKCLKNQNLNVDYKKKMKTNLNNPNKILNYEFVSYCNFLKQYI